MNHTGEAVHHTNENGEPRKLLHNSRIPREAWAKLRIFRIYK
ncbi:hypothetical protein LEP1GSC079_0335 [Leptospira interrogans str. FPW1039]|uniref:Uncharacterized protein n=1 Tax=Leptospira interrogans str. FPW1039 TaxID=1193040 RepID=A0A0F6IIF4_LEPIR|nr:hypothetical protein LEP1GSC079_0335 [Leptospira interrogans str. FPW1039]